MAKHQIAIIAGAWRFRDVPGNLEHHNVGEHADSKMETVAKSEKQIKHAS
jgi:hypothetical protein